MMTGRDPFKVQDGHLCLALRPAMPGWLFTEESEVSVRFLGHCTVTYHNPGRQDTPALQPNRIVFSTSEGGMIEVAGPCIKSPYADMVRNGQIKSLDFWF
jgi:hypothetical protein